MRNLTTILTLAFLLTQSAFAQFSTKTPLTPLTISANTREKPQAKVWMHDGKHFALLSNSDGAHVWRLDGTTWIKTFTISSKSTLRADCKVAGNVVHILLFRDASSEFVSVEYVATGNTYKRWTQRTSTIPISLSSSSETATIDIDTNNRMWLATDEGTAITVRWSDSPYATWSSPITVASGTDADDIGAVIALPMFNKVGVLWSNQITKRFGFKTHSDGTDPGTWSADELPAAQSALNVGSGFSDDHLNMKVASDGTLYCAVKTGYDSPGYPKISLLVRRPNGSWDNLYKVSELGTRGIVVLNEAIGKLRVIYTETEDGGDIFYKESSIAPISFGSQFTLISGEYNNPTSLKTPYAGESVILASTSSVAVGVLVSDGTVAPPPLPATPTLAAPAANATGVSLTPTLSWNSALNATSYQLQVATANTFQSTVFDNSNITSLSRQVSGLSNSTSYFWRVRATNSTGSSDWSEVRSFTTQAAAMVGTPTLASPADNATNINNPATLSWNVTANANTYEVQVAAASDFVTLAYTANSITGLSTQATGLAFNSLYYWRVRAVNSLGPGSWSVVRNFTTGAEPMALVAHWQMDETGGSILNDSSPMGNHATTVGNPLRVAGIMGQALQLNGTSQYATAPSSLSLNPGNAITISAWIRPSRSGSRQVILQKGRSSDGYEFALTGSRRILFCYNEVSAGSDYQVTSSGLHPMDGATWMHVAVTFDRNSVKLYLNGNLDKTKTLSSAPAIKSNSESLSLGAQNNGSSKLQGALDDVRVYNIALTAAEIAALAVVPAARIAGTTTQGDPQATKSSTDSENTINFISPATGEYTITLYDNAGKVVSTLKKGHAQEGENLSVEVDSSKFPEGLFKVRLQTATKSKTYYRVAGSAKGTLNKSTTQP